MIDPNKAPVELAMMRYQHKLYRLSRAWSYAFEFNILRAEEYARHIKDTIGHDVPVKEYHRAVEKICESAGISTLAWDELDDASISRRALPLLNRVGTSVYVLDGLVKARDVILQHRALVCRLAEWSAHNDMRLTPEEGPERLRHVLDHCSADIRFDLNTAGRCRRPIDECKADRDALDRVTEELGAKEQIWSEGSPGSHRDVSARERSLSIELGIAKDHVKKLLDKLRCAKYDTQGLGLEIPIVDFTGQDAGWQEFEDELEIDEDYYQGNEWAMQGSDESPDSVS